jgi:hypothetical protein
LVSIKNEAKTVKLKYLKPYRVWKDIDAFSGRAEVG